MKLLFDANIKSPFNYKITVNDKSLTVNDCSPKAEFDVDNNQEYDITIEQVSYNLCILDFIICFLTILIQGVFNILFFNYENQWYEDFSPYKLKAKIKYKTSESESDTIQFSCTAKKQPLRESDLRVLFLTFHSNPKMEIEYSENFKSLKRCFFNGIQKISSVYLIFYIFMSFRLHHAIVNAQQSNMIAVIISMIAIFGLYIFRICKEYKLYKKIKNLILLDERF